VQPERITINDLEDEPSGLRTERHLLLSLRDSRPVRSLHRGLEIAETRAVEGIAPERLSLHADRGRAMRAKTVARLLRELQVTKSHAHPCTPTDSPYSKAQLKTMKYRPEHPKAFQSMQEACDWAFIAWYNQEHHHSELALMTPTIVRHGQVERVMQQRQRVLEAAYAAHPERFVRGKPTPPKLPEVVWINEPQQDHGIIDLVGSAVSGREPGPQAGSRA
jgi:hypothetical protein